MIEPDYVFVLLNGIRGIAALAVVTWHLPNLFEPFVARSSYLAVDLFFLLSGLVIAHAYERRLVEGQSSFDFILVRLIRFYPLYLLGTGVGLAFWVSQMTWGSTAGFTLEALGITAFFSILFLPTPSSLSGIAATHPLLGPAWTLLLELAVNLFYSMIVRWLKPAVLVAVVTLSVVPLVAAGLHFGSLNVGFEWAHFWGGLSRVFYSFFAGVFVLSVAKKRQRPIVPTWMILVCIIGLLGFDPPIAYRAAYDLTVVLLVFPLLMLAAATAEVSGKAAALCGSIGVASYGVYVLHLPVGKMFAEFWGRAVQVDLGSYTPWLGITFAVSLILGVLILDRLFDRPVRRAMHQLMGPTDKTRLAS